MRTVVLSSLRHQARRYVAAGLAIAIAVGFVVAVNGLSGAARDGARDQVARELAGADLVVSGDLTSDPRIGSRVAEVPGVEAVALNRAAYPDVRIGSQVRTRAVGSIAGDEALRWQRPTTGRFPDGRDEVLLSSGATDGGRVGVGDQVGIRLGGRDRSFTVAGIVPASGGPNAADVYVGEDVLAGGSDGFATSLVARTGGDPAAVVDRVRSATSAEMVEVRSQSAYVSMVQKAATQGVDVLQNLVLAFALLSAFVGVLVIANTFTMLLAQRARDFALLRCVGAGRRQLVRGVVLEAAALAVVASAVGLAAGWGLAAAAAAVLRSSVPGMVLGGVELGPVAVLVPVAAAVLVTVLASWLPARRVARLSPLAALRPDATAAPARGRGRLRTVLATGVVGAGAAVLAVGTVAPSLPVAMLGGMVSFVGVLLLGPVVVPALVRAAGLLARRGVPGRLAVQNATRNPRRTAATPSALLIGVTLVTTVVVGTASVKADLGATLDASEPVDLSLTSAAGELDGAVADRVGDVDGVAALATLGGIRAEVAGQEVTALGVDRSARAIAHEGAMGRVRPGTVLASWDVLAAADASPGDRVRVTGVDGRSATLALRPSDSAGAALLVSPRDLRALGGTEVRATAVWARASADADAATTSADVGEIGAAAGLEPGGGLAERAEVMKVLDVVLAVTVGLLGVSVAIALVGVANTLGVSVLERTRENALLRALGLGRRGLRRTLGTEAVLMALVAAALGTALGVVYAWCGVRVMTAGVLGGLVVPWGQLAAVLLVATCAGLLASVLPARRAARTAPAAGLVAD